MSDLQGKFKAKFLYPEASAEGAASPYLRMLFGLKSFEEQDIRILEQTPKKIAGLEAQGIIYSYLDFAFKQNVLFEPLGPQNYTLVSARS